MSDEFRFELLSADPATGARRGRLHTPRGIVETPCFIPVLSVGTGNILQPDCVAGAGFQIILGDTGELVLKPGADVVARHGGLHRFMGWGDLILTGFGGFRTCALSDGLGLSGNGLSFLYHLSGQRLEFTPESVIAAQESLGSDIAMALNAWVPSGAGRVEIAHAVDLTTDWAKRSLNARRRNDQAVFGVVHGGPHMDLRLKHASELARLDFDGYALGGFEAVGSPAGINPAVTATAAALPGNKPRYLMDAGSPADMVRLAACGIDLFDSSWPARWGANGMFLTSGGRRDLRDSIFTNDTRPVDPECCCPVCSRYSASYLRHLHASAEPLATILNTTHNIYYCARLMEDVRQAVESGNILKLLDKITATLDQKQDRLADHTGFEPVLQA